MSLPVMVIVDPAAATTAAPLPLDDALYGGKSGKGAMAKSVKRTTESGKALPVKDAKAEKVMSISTKAAKTEDVPVLPTNEGTSCARIMASNSMLSTSSTLSCCPRPQPTLRQPLQQQPQRLRSTHGRR